MHELERNQRVDRNQSGDPERRGHGPFHLQGLMGQKDGLTCLIHPFRQHLVQQHPGRGLERRLGCLHFHFSGRQGPFRDLQFGFINAGLRGAHLFFRFQFLAVQEEMEPHFFDRLPLGGW